MPIPFSPERARNFARGLDEVFVVEEKQPNIESLIKDALYNEAPRPRVTGKYDEHDTMLLPGHGGLTADDLLGSAAAAPVPSHRTAGSSPEQPPRELIALNTEGGPNSLLLLGLPPQPLDSGSPTAPRWARASAATP